MRSEQRITNNEQQTTPNPCTEPLLHASSDLLNEMEFVPASVQASRPPFWFVTVFLYLVPCGGYERMLALSSSRTFYIGLVYCTYPLNLLTYAWNDYGDQGVDALNPRKGQYLFGTKGMSDLALGRMIRNALMLQLPFGVYFATVIGWMAALYYGAIVIVANFLYNTWPGIRKGPAPLDLFLPLSYLFVIDLSAAINGLEGPGWGCWAFHVFMALRSQLYGQIIDYDSDVKGKRRTTAITLGIRKSRLLVVLLVAFEACAAYVGFQDWYPVAFSVWSLAQALLEYCFYPEKDTSLRLKLLTFLMLTPPGMILCLRHIYYGILV